MYHTLVISVQLEALVVSTADRVLKAEPVEDSRIECKYEWIDAKKAARQIAGHANASQAEPVVWLIGVDERNHTIVGASDSELSNWWAQVQSRFDGLAPSLRSSICVPYRDKTIVALCFGTDRAPFVVKGDAAGQISFKVPWREGTSTRSARREDLLRILMPHLRVPAIDLMQAELRLEGSNNTTRFMGSFEFYITPRDRERIVIPKRKTLVAFDLGLGPIRARAVRLGPSTSIGFSDGIPRSIVHSETISATRSEALIDGPGVLVLEIECTKPVAIDNARLTPSFEISGKLMPAGAGGQIEFQCCMVRPQERPFIWEFHETPFDG